MAAEAYVIAFTIQINVLVLTCLIVLVFSSMCILVSPQQLPLPLVRRMLRLEVCFRLVLHSALALPLPSSLVVQHREGKFVRRSFIRGHHLTCLYLDISTRL
jgi:hypothetical protein